MRDRLVFEGPRPRPADAVDNQLVDLQPLETGIAHRQPANGEIANGQRPHRQRPHRHGGQCRDGGRGVVVIVVAGMGHGAQ